MDQCLFCKISSREIPCDLLYEDEHIVAFKDINPKTPVHVLIVPKRHIKNINEISDTDTELIGKMFILAKKLAFDYQLSETGYRLVINTRSGAGQTVDHLHLHLLGGKILGSMA
ncbi:MAG: histidine triad nucleotide-binding protein [Patescibacteria group bacterium]